MTDLREAAQQALEALDAYSWEQVDAARVALRAALEQPEQEPVALPCCGYADASAIKWNPLNGVVQCHNCGQTYTHPPRREWQGLTDEEIDDLYFDQFSMSELRGFARAIEAKLKEKNA